ncbi:MAG: glucosaminidase domain-containing protein [Treponemataceae bacterium]|nr:glucosaminidase domain-containing protein [Spirochaetales bacterium]MDY6030712.1 glucosaminidase domain-containing protein [Treponemataceae bacterium]
MRKCLSIVISLFVLVFLCFVNSCSTMRSVHYGNCSRTIDAKGIKNADQLVCFFLAHNPDADVEKVSRLASFYKMECKYEGINSDVAFVQMCLETGFLRFGNLVSVDMNNFCGLGAINSENPGLRFETEQLGVKAHVQHLHAYGTDRELKGECVDPRYKYVKPRKKAPTVFELSGTWAADKEYGSKLDYLLEDLGAF